MQTLASVAPISSLLEALEVGEPLSHGALTVIPLLAPREAEPDWLTLAEAGRRRRREPDWRHARLLQPGQCDRFMLMRSLHEADTSVRPRSGAAAISRRPHVGVDEAIRAPASDPRRRRPSHH